MSNNVFSRLSIIVPICYVVYVTSNQLLIFDRDFLVVQAEMYGFHFSAMATRPTRLNLASSTLLTSTILAAGKP
jgi:hypothetical protein